MRHCRKNRIIRFTAAVCAVLLLCGGCGAARQGAPAASLPAVPTQADACRRFCALYEALGGTIDIGSVDAVYADADEGYLRALALGLTNDDAEDFAANDPLNTATLDQEAAALIGAVHNDIFLTGGAEACGDDAEAICRVLFALGGEDMPAEGEGMASLAARADYSVFAGDAPLSRRALAEAMLRFYGTYLPCPAHEDALAAAIDMDMMACFPCAGESSPAYIVQKGELADMLIAFKQVFAEAWQNEHGGGQEDVGEARLMEALSATEALFDKQTPTAAYETGADNAGSGGWYRCQYDGSACENVNCMPACAVMAAAWQHGSCAAAPTALRADGDDDPWTLDMACAALDGLSVRWETRPLYGKESLFDALDEGNIVLAEICQKSSDIGHSIIICGYLRHGASDAFIIADPSVCGTAIDGTPLGARIYAEADALFCAADIWYDCFVAVPPAE